VKKILSIVLNSAVLLLVITNSVWANEINADTGTSAIGLLIGVALLIAEVKRRPNRCSSEEDNQQGKD
jgi:hypothetical protein